MFEYANERFYVGVDPSLTGFAIVIINQHGDIIEQKLIHTDAECYINIEQRLLDIFYQAKFVANIANMDMLYIEDLSFMSKSTSLWERIGLLYMIRTHLFKSNTNFEVKAPTALKKWHTTDGFATKTLMMQVAKCKWGLDFEDDNICDAYCLARWALEDYEKCQKCQINQSSS